MVRSMFSHCSIWARLGKQSSTQSQEKVPPFLGPLLCPRNLCAKSSAKLGFQSSSCAWAGQISGCRNGCGVKTLAIWERLPSQRDHFPLQGIRKEVRAAEPHTHPNLQPPSSCSCGNTSCTSSLRRSISIQR